MSNVLITALQNPELYDHPVHNFQVIETHISWVLLTGNFAYKIKKSVNFGFLDFSSLAKRRVYCHQEVRANQALSPDVYLTVVPITGSIDRPEFSGSGETIEYAILMREFNQENLFTALLKRDLLTSELIDAVALLLAKFHDKASRQVPDPQIGTPKQVFEPMQQNFEQIRELLGDNHESALEQIANLEQWAHQEWRRVEPILAERKANGFIRECHGDVHLGNIALIDDKPVIFDCIEFNDALRWTDTMADIAFITIDLIDNGCAAFSHQLLSYYLEHCPDYQGLAILPFYQVYRAVVRAKVNLFKYAQTQGEERTFWYQRFQHFLNLAQQLLVVKSQQLFITYGLAGSGKSTVSQTLVRERGVMRLRSDIIRKKLHDLDHLDQSDSGVNQKIYSIDATQRTYQLMAEYTKIVLSAGYSVVVDAAFLLHTQRCLFSNIAAAQDLPFIILVCAAPFKTLQTRIELRQAMSRDPSEATLEVLEMQRKTQEFLTKEELEKTIIVDAQDENRYNFLNKKVNDFLLSEGERI